MKRKGLIDMLSKCVKRQEKFAKEGLYCQECNITKSNTDSENLVLTIFNSTLPLEYEILP